MSRRAKSLPLAALSYCLLSIAVAAPAKPPKVPQMSKQSIDESKLVALKQPAALAAELDALSKGTVEERVALLKKKVLADLIFVKGGTFKMGDFGPLWSPDKLPYSDDPTNKLVHEVTLSSFSIAKYKSTYAEFDVYSDATKTERAANGRLDKSYRHPTVPAGVGWQPAKDYCQWLGKVTGLPIDLPTEAQWEYAARSRGQFFVWATDNGNIDYGRNIPAAGQMELLTPSGDVDPYPVGLFPPNPLGMYDASHNGEEWTNDWFDENYYKISPKQDPQGPSAGAKKVARGWPVGDSIVPNTIYRRARALPTPRAATTAEHGKGEATSYRSSGFRCALQQPTPVH